ncbi:thioredoxin-related transmembrane 4 [Pelobates cultripes]|uniref:Thioredoxin-related transmembrane 4 n=1 Tax=Pelobates cultripes TaxID=61616 RepID=A0AAD1RI18_PELCU|nr:thioredoxin-related transmembrane 4 [Pelobates cultripes]
MVGSWRIAVRAAHSGLRPGSVSAHPGLAVLALAGLLWVPGGCETVNGAPAAGTVRAVTAGNWSALLEGEWMVTFYAPWCPACQQIYAQWENLGEQSGTLDINVGKVDVTQEPGLSGRFFVTTLPSIFHAKDGVFRRYHGSRIFEDLQSFIKEEKWKLVEPIGCWKSPSSILMSGMAGLFQLSGWIRQTHNYFTGPLEIPVWGSYVIFIVATLLIGLILGLILVLLADCCCPSKAKYEVVRAEENEENLDVPTEGSKEPLEENKELSDNEGESESDDEDAEEGSDDAKDSDEDSAVEESDTEEDTIPPVENISTSEPESALRQRKTETVADNEQ